MQIHSFVLLFNVVNITWSSWPNSQSCMLRKLFTFFPPSICMFMVWCVICNTHGDLIMWAVERFYNVLVIIFEPILVLLMYELILFSLLCRKCFCLVVLPQREKMIDHCRKDSVNDDHALWLYVLDLPTFVRLAFEFGSVRKWCFIVKLISRKCYILLWNVYNIYYLGFLFHL